MPSHPSPLRYPGGKHSLAPLLADIIVQNDLHDGTIAEPFAGGAAASLRLMFDEVASDVMINDADPRIFAFWRAVVNQTEDLVARIRKARLSMAQWERCRMVYDAPSTQSQLELAFAVFFLNRCNRSGILMGGGPIGGYKQKGTWKLGARFNRDDLIARVRRIAAYRERLQVTRMDARTFLRGLKAKTRTLVYLDPPYYRKGQRLYLNAFSHRDHCHLAKLLLREPPFNWVLTYDNVEPIRKLYKSLNPRPFELSYSAYKRRSGRELLIFDPRLDVPNELIRLHDRPGRLCFA